MEEEPRRFLCRRAASVLSCPLTDQVNERLILISVGLVAELIEDRIFGRLRIFLLVTEGEEYLIRGFLKTDDLPAAGPGGACCDPLLGQAGLLRREFPPGCPGSGQPDPRSPDRQSALCASATVRRHLFRCPARSTRRSPRAQASDSGEATRAPSRRFPDSDLPAAAHAQK